MPAKMASVAGENSFSTDDRTVTSLIWQDPFNRTRTPEEIGQDL